MFQKDMRISALIDIYGTLLTERKREIMEFYYNDDYSLAEIAENTGISRQGVRDSIKKSEAELAEFEEKLRLADMYSAFEEFKTDFADRLESVSSSLSDGSSEEILKLADEIRNKNL